MIVDQHTFSANITRLLLTGREVFLGEEAQQAVGVSHGALLDAAERQQGKQHLVNPRGWYCVSVPSWGAPPPWYIDYLMRHEGRRPYYLGSLKAAGRCTL